MNAHQQPVPGEVRQAASTDSAADCARYAATFAQVLRPAELVHLTLHPCLACEYIRPGTGSMPASRAWQHRRKTRALGAVEGGGGCPEIALRRSLDAINPVAEFGNIGVNLQQPPLRP